MILKQKELVEDLKVEWKRLWRERVDDKLRAEGIAVDDYSSLFIDKGTVIHATRDFKVLNFKDILEQYKIENLERYIPPDPAVGGWNKFVKENIINKKPMRHCEFVSVKSKKPLPQKKSGRGWLHI
ncbi:MAG: hypothetical protein ACQCN4_05825 [Candidatus Bathyarchaeia archaeon]|jgi:hypothetical protein